jgi:hypothetical protein
MLQKDWQDKSESGQKRFTFPETGSKLWIFSISSPKN